FDLNSIKLEGVRLHYIDERHEQHYQLLASYLRARLGVEGPLYNIALKGNLHSDSLLIGQDAYLRNMPVEVDGRFTYNDKSGELDFEPTNLLVEQSDFWLEGKIGTSGTTSLDLSFEAKQTDFGTLQNIL